MKKIILIGLVTFSMMSIGVGCASIGENVGASSGGFTCGSGKCASSGRCGGAGKCGAIGKCGSPTGGA